MKPRIFISSTFYDLKYIREDLANFVRAHDYEPVLFEDGDIGYTPGKNLDKSCYDAMRNSDMVILIIGGEYGSAASGETKDEFKEYLSVTRNEFRTAIESGVPVFVMIDKKIIAEYGVYDANYDFIENQNGKVKFASTKNVNVFRFIKEVKGIVALPIQEFEKSADIKGFISKQWADMFKNYLDSLKIERENKKIENSVNEMKDLIQKMDIMLDSVGKNILSKENPADYKNVIIQQDIISFCEVLSDCFYMRIKNRDQTAVDMGLRKNIIKNFVEILKETHQKKLWEDFESDNKEKVINFFCLFDKEDFEIESIAINYIEKIDNKCELLFDDKNMNDIVDMMTRNKYFYRLLEP